MTWLQPKTQTSVVRQFIEPVLDLDVLERCVSEACTELCRVLEARAEGARRVDLVVARVDGASQALRVGLSAPSRAPDHLVHLLAQRFDQLHADHGAEGVRSDGERRLAGWTPPRPHPFRRATTTPRSACTYRPSSIAWLHGPACGASTDCARMRAACPSAACDARTRWHRLRTLGRNALGPRPPRLLRPPQLVQAIAQVPDHPPIFFVWRNTRHRVAQADGPERVRGEWWRTDAERECLRDYYTIEDETGRRFWLFRDAAPEDGGRWFLHGLW